MFQGNVESSNNLSSKRVAELHINEIGPTNTHSTNCWRDDDKKLEGEQLAHTMREERDTYRYQGPVAPIFDKGLTSRVNKGRKSQNYTSHSSLDGIFGIPLSQPLPNSPQSVIQFPNK